MTVFKGSLYIFNLLCGLLPCEQRYPYPDTSFPSVPEGGRISVAERVAPDSGEVWDGDKNDLYKDIDYNKIDPLIVQTDSGKMKGYWMRAVGGRKIRAFEGIPYATAPMNDLRFKAPLPVKPWTGLLEANLQGPKCLQYNDIKQSRVIGSENCLYLNIYSRYLKNSTKKYPVIIYIHSGSFLTGSGNDFGPAYLLMRDLVLVTINYRIGVMGFMSTSSSSSPGNYGLKDQAEAINWVHRNIDKYMGDPGRIILLGHAAGGSSVHFQMMSFKARGKFVGGISISGTAFNQWAMHTKDQAVNLTKSFAKSFHCPVHGPTEDTVNCLRKQRGFDLVKRQIQFLDKWPVPLSLFRPVIEEEYGKEEPFLTESPEEAYRKGTVDMIPWICGQTEDEGYNFLLSHVAAGTFADLRRKFNEYAPDLFNFNELPVDQDEITRRVNWLYFRHVSPQNAPLKVYSDAIGARMIHTGIHKALQAHSQHAETYAFMFGYNGKYNLASAAGIKPTEWAVGHGEILGYILNSTSMYAGFQKGDSELVLSKILVNLIYNFAEKQVPGFTTSSSGDFHLWNRITDPRNMSFLHLDKNIKMIPEPYLQQTLYWESLGLPDCLPLANYSSEIDNLKEKNPDSKGFVSTDVSKSEGMSIPPDLQPPSIGFKEDFFATFSNVTFDNKIDTNPEAKKSALDKTRVEEITFTTPEPPAKRTTSTPKPSSSSTTIRWFAQDFQLPRFRRLNLTLAKRQPLMTTTTSRPRSIPNRAARTRLNGGVVIGNLIDTVLKQNPFVGPYDNFHNASRGVSVPVVGGPDPYQNFVTRSNINMSLEYLKQYSSRRKEVNADETMIMDSNSNSLKG